MLKTLLGAALFAATLSLAHATVSFDVTTGQGFIGRGDVLSHPTLGKDALVQAPIITVDMTISYEVEIEWTTGPEQNRKTHTITRDVTLNIAARTETETRNAKGKVEEHVTGYRLLGYIEEGQAEAAFTPPQVGDVILDNDHIEKVVTAVTAMSVGDKRLKFAAVPTALVGWFDLP